MVRLIREYLDVGMARDAGLIAQYKALLPRYGNLQEENNLKRFLGDLFRDPLFRHRFGRFGMKLDPQEFFARLQKRTYPEIVELLLRDFSASLGKSRWGNKKPSDAFNMAMWDELFPHCKFVHIIRDGRDVAISMRTSHVRLHKNYYWSAKDWQAHVLAAREYGQTLSGDRYFEFTYEALLQQPVETFTELTRFIGANGQEPAVIDRFINDGNGRIRQGNYCKWKHKMTRSDVRLFERVAGTTLGACGYEIVNRDEVAHEFTPIEVLYCTIDNIVRKLLSPKIYLFEVSENIYVAKMRLAKLATKIREATKSTS